MNHTNNNLDKNKFDFIREEKPVHVFSNIKFEIKILQR